MANSTIEPKLPPLHVSVIGICGRSGAGKSTMSRYIEYYLAFERSDSYIASHLVSAYLPLPMAAPLKKACAELFGFTPEQMTDPVLKEKPDAYYGVTPRRVLQIMGTEVLRDCLPPLLVPHIAATDDKRKKLLHSITTATWRRSFDEHIERARRDRFPTHVVVVVDDVRFPDEIDAIKSVGGSIVLVERSNQPTTNHNNNQHRSESLIDSSDFTPDYVIVNDGESKAEFHARIREFMNEGMPPPLPAHTLGK